MSQSSTAYEKLLLLVQTKGVIRLNEIEKFGIHHEYVRRLCKAGKLIKLSKGLYASAEYDITEHHSIVEICQRIPHAIICLLSALIFHGLTTQMPHEIWIAIGNKAHRPQIEYPPIRISRFSDKALQAGVEEHTLEGCVVKVYCPAKTVVDCFKFRNKIGLDVALEALHDVFRQRKATYNEIVHYAKICRIEKIIKPYLETVAWERSEH